MMLGLLKETAKNYSLRIYAFCLMPNHCHLLLSPEEPNLYDAMRYLFSRYAMRFNRKHERKGHLFGGPYRQGRQRAHGSQLMKVAKLYILWVNDLMDLAEGKAYYCYCPSAWSFGSVWHRERTENPLCYVIAYP